MATLTNLVVRISGNTTSLNKAVDQSQTRMQKFSRSTNKVFGQLRRVSQTASLHWRGCRRGLRRRVHQVLHGHRSRRSGP